MKRQERIPLAPLAVMLVLSMTATGCYTTLATAPHPSGIDQVGEVQVYPRPEMVPPSSASDSIIEANADSSYIVDTYDERTGLVVINNYYGYPGWSGTGWNFSIGYDWGWNTCMRPYHRPYGPPGHRGWYNEIWGVWSCDPWNSPYGPDRWYWYDPSYSSWYWSDPWYFSWYSSWYDPWYYPVAYWHEPYRPWYDHDDYHGGGGGGNHGGTVNRPDNRIQPGPGGIISRRGDATATNRTFNERTSTVTPTTSPRDEGRVGPGTVGGRRNQSSGSDGTVNKSSTENSGTRSSRMSGGTRQKDDSFFDTISRRVNQEIDAHVRGSARTQMDDAERNDAAQKNSESTSNKQTRPSQSRYPRGLMIRGHGGETWLIDNGGNSRRTSTTNENASSGTQNTNSSGRSSQSREQDTGSSSSSYSPAPERSSSSSEERRYSAPAAAERSTGSSGSSGESYQSPHSGGGDSGGGGGRPGAGDSPSRRR